MEHSRFAILTRHFLGRFLDNDLISPSGDAHVGVSQVLAALVLPGLLIVITVMLKYSHYRLTWDEVVDLTFSDATVFVALAMILFGVAAAIAWDAFYLDPRDEVVLGSLPVSARLLAGAKLAALGVFLVVFTAALNAIPVLLAPTLTIRPVRSATLGQLLRLTAGQAGASVGAGLWAALAVVALRGLLGWLLPGRAFRRVGPLVQGGLVLLILGWAVSLPHFLLTAESVWKAGGTLRDLSPPFWFVGVHRYLVGSPDAAGVVLAGRGVAALLATAAVVVLVYFGWPARRQFAGSAALFERDNRRSAAARFVGAVAGLAFRRRPIARATFEFTLLGLGRSSMHRLYLAAALGAGIAWSMGSAFWAAGSRAAAATPGPAMLQMQPILTLLLVVAVRFAVTVPVTLQASWLFRVTEREPASCYRTGTRRAALAIGVLPVAVLIPAHAFMWGWSVAAYHALVGACYAAVIVELLFGSQIKVPFGAPYVSGAIQLKTRWLLYLSAGSVLTAGPAALESVLLRPGWPAWTLPALLAGLSGVLAALRRRRERLYPGLLFEDLPPDAIQTLSIFDYAR